MGKEIKVLDIHIPDGYVKIQVSNKDDFFGMIEEEGSYFCQESKMLKEYFVFGDGMVFLYDEVVK